MRSWLLVLLRVSYRADLPPQLAEAALKLHKALAVLMPDTIWLQSIAMLPKDRFSQLCSRRPPHPSLPRMSHASQLSAMRIGCCSAEGGSGGARLQGDMFAEPARKLLAFVEALQP